MPAHYVFYDGSALLADLAQLRRKKPEYLDRRIVLVKLAQRLVGSPTPPRRVVFYFTEGDPRVKRNFVLPDYHVPEAVHDLAIEYCGKRVSSEDANEWLREHEAPPYVQSPGHGLIIIRAQEPPGRVADWSWDSRQ